MSSSLNDPNPAARAPRSSLACLLPAFVFLGVLISYGIAEGLWTNRWFASAELARATARLERVPRVIGDWEGTDQTMDARTIEIAELSGYVMRRYVNRRTGAAISTLLVCGRPGPTAQHTPEICYVGAGFAAKDPPKLATVTVPASTSEKSTSSPHTNGGPAEVTAEFWLANYAKGGPTPEALRIYWAWNATGTWHASAHPRIDFAYHAALYKLYVVRQMAKANEPLTNEPAVQFMEIFLPVVQDALFGKDERLAARAEGEKL